MTLGTVSMDSNSLVGKPAPRFIAHSSQGQLDLGSYEGSWVILFCHPADFTPVCTTEFIALTQRKAEFEALGVELIGLSVDSVYSHVNWVDWIDSNYGVKVEFPIVEDMSMEIAKAYQMIDSSSTSSATVRACIFIDPDQIVQAVIHYPMSVGRSVDEILRVQQALCAVSTHAASTPANWSPGEKLMATGLETFQENASGWLKRSVDSAGVVNGLIKN